MLMLPHHFQAADAYLAELIGTSHAWLQPYGYGLHEDCVNSAMTVARLLGVEPFDR